MSATATGNHRFLPRGWGDLGRQVVIWFGFLLAYQLARGLADRNPARAFENALTVIRLELDANALFETTLQGFVHSSDLLMTLASWTYWLSQFTVVGLALLWVYLWRNDAFTRVRNLVLVANVIGLVGYVFMPTAPPRMFPDFGFVDTLARYASLNHGSGLVELASNPFAAMPSLHAADALVVGFSLAVLCRRWFFKAVWVLWPAWVSFCVMATGNHFWLDIVAGVFVVALAALLVFRREVRGVIRRAAA